MNTRKAILTILVILALGLPVVAAYAQQASDYDYATMLTITNETGSDLTDVLIPFDINADELVDSGYLNSDGQDILILSQSGGAEALHIAQATTTDPARWWVHVDSLADSASASYTIYTGENTSAADNPQGIWLSGATDTVEVDDAASLDITSGTMTIDDLSVISLPDSTMALFERFGLWTIKLSAAGTITGQFFGASACNLTGPTITAGAAPFDLAITLNDAENVCSLLIDGQVFDTDTAVIPVSTGSQPVTSGGTAGFIGHFGGLHIEDETGSDVLDLQFEMPHMTETQEGTSGNSWTWTSSVEDQSGQSNDATWTHVQDTTNITVTLGPVTAVSAAASTLGEDDPEFVQGTITPPVDQPYTAGTTADDFGFPFNIMAGIVVNAGTGNNKAPLMLLAGIVTVLGTLGSGFAAFRFMGKIPAIGILTALVVGGYLIIASPLENVTIILLVLSLGGALFLIDRPLEART